MNDGQDVLSQQVLRKFLKLNRYLRKYSRQIDSTGLRPKDFSVLLFLLESEPTTVGAVQDYLYSSPSLASSILSRLESVGYVSRTRSQQDNRVVIVELTPAGRKIAESTPLGGIPLLRRRLGNLSTKRLKQIDEALFEIMVLMEVKDNQ